MKILIPVFVCILFVSCQGTSSRTNENLLAPGTMTKDTISAHGYWQIPEESRFIRLKNEILSPGNYLFYYDSSFVTLYLFTEKAWMWKSEDDYYKLNAKWGHDSLFYLPPFGRWTYLAVFDGANFSVTLQDSVFKYNKINKAEISKEDSAILKERKLHDYNIKATDRPE